MAIINNRLVIDDIEIGSKKPCFIIAEIGQAHEGSLGMAMSYINVAKKVGADAVKFQTHISEAESSQYEPFRVSSFLQDKTRTDYWDRTSFTKEEWGILFNHSKKIGIKFFSTPFSREAVDMLSEIGQKIWKIPSGEVTNFDLLEYIVLKNEPVLLSTGMSSWDEISDAVVFLKSHKTPFAILQCTSSYPCSPSEIGLQSLETIRDKYNCLVGFSDHTGQIGTSIAARSLGASIIEMHLTFSKDSFGPDVSSSLTIDEMSLAIQNIRFVENSLNIDYDKDLVAKKMIKMKEIFQKGIYAKKNLKKDHLIVKEDISILKPMMGLSAKYSIEIIGCRLKNNVLKGEPIFNRDIDLLSKILK